MRELLVIRHATMGYEEALRLQLRLVERLRENAGGEDGFLVLLEHPRVITIGRTGRRQHVLVDDDDLHRRGVALYETNRGGDVTYHGPGQLVAYPVIRLEPHGRDLHGYLRRLEDVVIRTLSGYGIEAARRPSREYRKADGAEAPMTGAWVGDRKIASIGIAVTHWIAYHGVALNVATDLRDYDLIHPCGLSQVRMTSLKELMDAPPTVAEVAERFAGCFAAEFGFHSCRIEGESGS